MQCIQHFIYDIQGYLPGRTGLPGVGKGHGRAKGFAAQAAHGTQKSVDRRLRDVVLYLSAKR